MDKQEQEKLRRSWKKWSPIFIVLVAAVWTGLTALVAGVWSVYQFKKSSEQFATELEFKRREAEAKRADEQKAREDARAATEADNTKLRRIEAQKPFLEKRLQAYFEAIKVSSRLTELHLSPDSDEWKENSRKFFQVRWGELEMVGDPGIRNAARLVGEWINWVAENPDENRHFLRWSVECLANELRLSLEESWGVQNTRRKTILGQAVTSMPSGCNQGTDSAWRPPGMPSPMQQGRRPQQAPQ